LPRSREGATGESDGRIPRGRGRRRAARGVSRPISYSVVPSVSCRPRRRTDDFSNRCRRAGRVRFANNTIGATVGRGRRALLRRNARTRIQRRGRRLRTAGRPQKAFCKKRPPQSPRARVRLSLALDGTRRSSSASDQEASRLPDPSARVCDSEHKYSAILDRHVDLARKPPRLRSSLSDLHKGLSAPGGALCGSQPQVRELGAIT
jgi:hypothetical protein